MNWIKDFVRPKLQKLVGGSKDIPDNLWNKCPECSQMIFHRDMEKNLHVCKHCGYQMRLAAKNRMDMLFDNSKYKVAQIAKTLEDPLTFRDRQKYAERLKEAREKTGEEDDEEEAEILADE